jgi:Ca2+-transporting ATPase
MSRSDMTDKHWHTESAAAVLAALDASAQGLTSAEAKQRIAQHGPNALPEGSRRSPLRMLVDQFADFMILVLIAAAVVSGIVGEPSDTIAIFVIVLLNAVIGFVQEWRAERAMAALRLMAAASAWSSPRGSPPSSVASPACSKVRRK